MILQPFYLLHNTGEEFIINFKDIIKVSRFVVEKEYCLSIHTDKFNEGFSLSLRRKEDVSAFEDWLKDCKAIIKNNFEQQISKPPSVLKMETKSK